MFDVDKMRDELNRQFIRKATVVVGMWFVVVGILAFCSVARAQSDHHPFHSEFYQQWKQPGIFPLASCCNARITKQGTETGDCEPTQADMRKGIDGLAHWFAWLRQERRWIEIPDTKIIHERNPSGQDAHLCWSTGRVLCFSPPDTGG